MPRPRKKKLTPAGLAGALAGVAALSTPLARALCFRRPATAGATNPLRVTFRIPLAAILLGAGAGAGIGVLGAGSRLIDGRLLRAAGRGAARRAPRAPAALGLRRGGLLRIDRADGFPALPAGTKRECRARARLGPREAGAAPATVRGEPAPTRH
jgi:hypothetical protein